MMHRFPELGTGACAGAAPTPNPHSQREKTSVNTPHQTQQAPPETNPAAQSHFGAALRAGIAHAEAQAATASAAARRVALTRVDAHAAAVSVSAPSHRVDAVGSPMHHTNDAPPPTHRIGPAATTSPREAASTKSPRAATTSPREAAGPTSPRAAAATTSPRAAAGSASHRADPTSTTARRSDDAHAAPPRAGDAKNPARAEDTRDASPADREPATNPQEPPADVAGLLLPWAQLREAEALPGWMLPPAADGAAPAAALRAVDGIQDAPMVGLGAATTALADPLDRAATADDPPLDITGRGVGAAMDPARTGAATAAPFAALAARVAAAAASDATGTSNTSPAAAVPAALTDVDTDALAAALADAPPAAGSPFVAPAGDGATSAAAGDVGIAAALPMSLRLPDDAPWAQAVVAEPSEVGASDGAATLLEAATQRDLAPPVADAMAEDGPAQAPTAAAGSHAAAATAAAQAAVGSNGGLEIAAAGEVAGGIPAAAAAPQATAAVAARDTDAEGGTAREREGATAERTDAAPPPPLAGATTPTTFTPPSAAAGAIPAFADVPLPVDGLDAAVAHAATQGIRQMTLQVTPPELGPVDLRVRVSGGQVFVDVRAASEAAGTHLQQHSGELQRMLAAAQLDLGGIQVLPPEPVGIAADGGSAAAFAQGDRDFGSGDRGTFGSAGGDGGDPATNAGAAAALAARAPSGTGTRLVDVVA